MKRTLTLLTLSLVILLSSLTAQEKRSLTNNEIQNLKSGIQSENTGLKRSSIYFAGYYKVREVSNELRGELLSNNDPKVRILAALALYEIGDTQLVYDLEELVNDTTENLKVRRMARAIYDEFKSDNSQSVVTVSH